MKIIVPMAGLGSRFQKEADKNPEYRKPKPFIIIKGKLMVQWALESLPFTDLPYRKAVTEMIVYPKDFIFILRQAHQDEFRIADKLREFFSDDINIILIDKMTRGAAETVYKAKQHINSQEDILVSDSDHYFDGSFLYEKIKNKDRETEGIIPVFCPPDNEPKWSFSLIGKNDVIKAVGEKDRDLVARGAYANIGGYYFSHGSTFISEVEEMIENNDLYGDEEKKEFYVAPVYERLIKKGMKIVAAITPKVWGLGTPRDVEYFKKNFK